MNLNSFKNNKNLIIYTLFGCMLYLIIFFVLTIYISNFFLELLVLLIMLSLGIFILSLMNKYLLNGIPQMNFISLMEKDCSNYFILNIILEIIALIIFYNLINGVFEIFMIPFYFNYNIEFLISPFLIFKLILCIILVPTISFKLNTKLN